MKVLNDVSLSKYTTFKMGGTCSRLWFPQSIDELNQALNTLQKPWYILGGGSNVVINDARNFDDVICLREVNRDIEDLGNGRFAVGASVSLQKLILKINEQGYGGIEYLFSVPGLVGGAVYMNAGRGAAKQQVISQFIESVDVLEDGVIKTYSVEDCCFAHRYSVFHQIDAIIINVHFHFMSMSYEETERLRKERIQFCKEKQDMSAPNFGTVFCKADGRIMKCVAILSRFSKKETITYSSKSPNWMLNKGGTFVQVQKKLKLVKKLHKLLNRDIKQEVILWE